MALTDALWGHRSLQSQPWSSSTGVWVTGDQVCEDNRAVAWPAGSLAWPGLQRRSEKPVCSPEVLDQATCPHGGAQQYSVEMEKTLRGLYSFF